VKHAYMSGILFVVLFISVLLSTRLPRVHVYS